MRRPSTFRISIDSPAELRRRSVGLPGFKRMVARDDVLIAEEGEAPVYRVR